MQKTDVAKRHALAWSGLPLGGSPKSQRRDLVFWGTDWEIFSEVQNRWYYET
jgi:hypothetical protein